jgi:hypothetical protein
MIAIVLLLLMPGMGSAASPWPPQVGMRGTPPFPQPPPFAQPPPFPSDRTSPYRASPEDPWYREPGSDRFIIRKWHPCEVHCQRIGRSRDYHCREYCY